MFHEYLTDVSFSKRMWLYYFMLTVESSGRLFKFGRLRFLIGAEEMPDVTGF
jgi:hypothetical protein